MAGNIESEIAALFARTQRENALYQSAHYAQEGHGKTGLGNRLEAFEQAVLIMARAVDELRAVGRSGGAR